ncbi:MAG: HAMP domain-containing protein [Lachnospiraceae bacterium]|nr:HAMP domain-containing protein [Lachnospiraceae bacterium]
MLHSIRTKLIFIMLLMMGFMLFLFWLGTHLLLGPFYVRSKVKLLEESYELADQIVKNDSVFEEKNRKLSSESCLKLEILNENRSIDLYVFDVDNLYGKFFYIFQFPDPDAVKKQTIQDLTENYLYDIGETADLTSDQLNEERKESLIKESASYNVFKAYDERIGSDYLELFGSLTSGPYIYLRTNYQSMSDNIYIFNRFLFYAGGVALLFGVFWMLYFGNSFAKPIMQITDIAKKMSELDFNVKYPVHSKDEVAVLGSSINVLSETLETTISELKAANNELQKDIEKKIQIDEMRKEFLSNVSHELKTPIALIQGYAEGLQDNISEDKESRDFYCEVIIDEAKKMNRMVQKLLTLNQIEFGNEQLSFERFDIVGLIENVMHSARLLADQKDAEMFFHEDYEPVYVWADEYMVEEVVTNYISNAIHHVDGEKKIEVFVEKAGKNVKVRVFNTGAQIPEEDLDKIWIKFYKVDKARTRAYGGSGIGLSIVKAIMEAMHHACGVRNLENGVEFWFELDG